MVNAEALVETAELGDQEGAREVGLAEARAAEKAAVKAAAAAATASWRWQPSWTIARLTHFTPAPSSVSAVELLSATTRVVQSTQRAVTIGAVPEQQETAFKRRDARRACNVGVISYSLHT
mmetsp:Transcript_17950/g.38814  ORF Transcript_17950/g.38814 Transcript_17950/m.38814 type:complete len:121 (-) Transcript_17950:476-838(-)